jgi:hypothetical protein
MSSRLRSCLRLAAFVVAEAGLVPGLYALTAEPLRHLVAILTGTGSGGHPLPLSVVVVALAAAVTWLALALVCVSTMAAAATLVRLKPSRWGHLTYRLAGPRWLQRAVLSACGVSLLSPVAALATPAAGCPEPQHTGSDSADAHAGVGAGVLITGSSVPADEAAEPRLTGLAMPDLPDSGRWGTAVHVVRPGDSLWDIAQQGLSAGASEAAISRHVHALHRVNRDVIGSDPDLIYPGTPLVLPGGKP